MMLSIVYILYTHTHSVEKYTNNSSLTKQHTHDKGRKGRKSVDKIKRPFNSSIPYICTWRSIWNVYERTGWKTAHVTRAIPIWIDSMRKRRRALKIIHKYVLDSGSNTLTRTETHLHMENIGDEGSITNEKWENTN